MIAAGLCFTRVVIVHVLAVKRIVSIQFCDGIAHIRFYSMIITWSDLEHNRHSFGVELAAWKAELHQIVVKM